MSPFASVSACFLRKEKLKCKNGKQLSLRKTASSNERKLKEDGSTEAQWKLAVKKLAQSRLLCASFHTQSSNTRAGKSSRRLAFVLCGLPCFFLSFPTQARPVCPTRCEKRLVWHVRAQKTHHKGELVRLVATGKRNPGAQPCEFLQSQATTEERRRSKPTVISYGRSLG